MARIPLSLVKAQLRLTSSSVAEDTLLTAYTDAAEEYCELYCHRVFGSSLPAGIVNACLLLVGSMFTVRESIIVGTIVADNPIIKDYLNKYRDLRDYFGPAVDPAVLVPTDQESIFRGDSWSREWRLSDESGAVNLTGYTGTFELYSGESVIHSGTLSLVGSHPDMRFEYALTAAVTGALQAELYWYKTKATAPSGDVLTLDRRQVMLL